MLSELFAVILGITSPLLAVYMWLKLQKADRDVRELWQQKTGQPLSNKADKVLGQWARQERAKIAKSSGGLN